MLTVEINARDMERARLLAAKYPVELRAAMFKANRDSGSALTRKIKDNLSGPVLNFISGNLRRNWAQIMPRVADGENAWVGGAGSGRTEYAAVHEFGMDKFFPNTPVKAHQRAQGGRVVNVKAHSRNQHVKIPARPYARRALTEVRGRIEAIHSDGIRQAWEKSK